MNIVYKVVDMNIKDFTKKFWDAKKARDAFDFQDKILLETKIYKKNEWMQFFLQLLFLYNLFVE